MSSQTYNNISSYLYLNPQPSLKENILLFLLPLNLLVFLFGTLQKSWSIGIQ